MRSKKQAVLLIHGVGFQRPMRTLRGFVDAVWTSDGSLRRPKVPATAWSKPDTISRSFELRRLTTAQNTHGVRTDFFEFYWAHLMHGTTLQQVFQWIRALLMRSPRRIPRPLRVAYVILWIAALWIVVAALNAAMPEADRWWQAVPLLSAVGSVILLPVLVWLLREFVGDAAVYLDAAPSNIQRRHEIRTAGVRVLKVLHRRGYDRIVVVGHSLGSVIGYDILKYAWADMHEMVGTSGEQPCEMLEALEHDAASMTVMTQEQRAAFRDRQRAYLKELRDGGHPWRVTDFITLGSPLTYAPFLLAAGAADFKRQCDDRELPRCPPVLEEHKVDGQEVLRLSFEKTFILPDGQKVKRQVAHHAALFAPVVWTNLYFPCTALVRGDIIGGPIAPVLGPAILDVELRNGIRGGWLLHTHYWTQVNAQRDSHIDELRKAIDLGRPASPAAAG